ncbi:MAG: hypothetical protein JNM18_18095 [Planctomycetaceae bacterium]|nr:hypothetical protein [Planctomycetaceae bacterium]
MTQYTQRPSRRTATSPTSSKPSALYRHDAEIALTASILLAPDLLPTVTTICTTADIQDPSCRMIYSTATMLDEHGEAVSVNAVVDHLGQCNAILAADVAEAITDAVPVGCHAVYYGAAVAEAAKRRRIQATLHEIATANRNGATFAAMTPMVAALSSEVAL